MTPAAANCRPEKVLGWAGAVRGKSASVANSHPVLQHLRDDRRLGIFISGFSFILTGLNFMVTTHTMRAPGLTWFRLPLFVWAHYGTRGWHSPAMKTYLAAPRDRAKLEESPARSEERRAP